MGTAISRKKLNTGQELFRLLIYTGSGDEAENAISINKLLARELVDLRPRQRTMQLENCFYKVLSSLPENPTIKDIDVMFNPAYKVDVMKILLSVYKQKPFSLVWPGSYEDGRLVYSEENLQDYKTYEINDYDIVCVI